jgi:hypothetical protein
MKIDFELYDPTGVRVCTSQIEIPMNLYTGEGEPRSQNYYILNIGKGRVKINKDGSLKVL